MTKKIKEQVVTPKHVASALAVETTYKREEIEGSASSFGVFPEVLAGALKLVEGEVELSRSQVENAIEAFKKRKV